MQLLIDSDVFCKFAVCGILSDVSAMLGATRGTCWRLPDLGYILTNRKSRHYRDLGPQLAAVAADVAKDYQSLPLGDPAMLSLFTGVKGIDPGEVRLFAAAASSADALILTGDKRAITALGQVRADVRGRLYGKIVPQDAALLRLCEREGFERIVARVHPHAVCDGTMRLCFPRAKCDPRECLSSYVRGLTESTDEALIHRDYARGVT